MFIPADTKTLSVELPPEHCFGLPEPEEIHEDGFGFFSGVWRIVGGTFEDATLFLDQEEAIFRLVAEASNSADEFEEWAAWAEFYNSDAGLEWGDAPPDEAMGQRIDEEMNYEASLLGLDLGVAGLVHALAAAGFYPAASCRGHAATPTWSARPVVLFASTLEAAQLLQPLVLASGCGFVDGSGNGTLIGVEATSIEHTIALARAILDNGVKLVAGPGDA